ncbi:4a-hydroxytetrahydrobiopterin dehydratase [Candidatus Woesearchaeota archaeon]|jgi:4a-hydroxytetrahydrobiopterin dehydratase|nr:4a-hydroxytetrahydrobiopterin dehydratase [Candidatus Woesearchaeota archaeon]|tara:strand:- start:17564 stop:17842 length:279 start_codon:yes stop_codon:yes gene_type:complete
MPNLSIIEIQEKLSGLKDWEMMDEKISKTFEFPGFKEALAFVNKIAEEAEKQNHHPDILIKYNKVIVNLTTHSEGGLTAKDFELAGVIEQLV